MERLDGDADDEEEDDDDDGDGDDSDGDDSDGDDDDDGTFWQNLNLVSEVREFLTHYRWNFSW